MIQANFQNNRNEGTVNGIRTKNKRINSSSDKKGPMKACYNPQEDKWALKYSYRSSQTVQKPTSATRRSDKNNFDSSSDYGTMSRPDADEDHFQQDAVPSLNLNNGGGNNKMNTFNDISIALRRERIDNILSDIMSVPRLVDSNLSRRTLSRSSSVRRHVSSDRMSDAGSVADSRISKRSHGSSSSLRRSASSPKLDFIPEIKTTTTSRKKRENKPGALGKIPEMPPVKQAIRKPKPNKKPRVPALNLNTTADDLSIEHLPHRDELLTKLVPTLGDDTKNELAISAPTLGDDTHNDMSALTLDDDTLMDETDTFIDDDSPVDYVQQNIRKAAANHPKGSDSGRSTASTMISTKHKAGSVPKYLKSRQAAWRDAEAAALAAIPDPDCPPGHRLLSSEERQEGLEARRERHREVIMEVNRLPVSSDTRRVRVRREELEAELGTLDAEITVYSRSKVFVNASADAQKEEKIGPQMIRGQSVLSVDWPL